MKVLIDPIPSAPPCHCSTMAKAQKIVSSGLERREDVFFRVLISDRADEESCSNLIRDPRVQYVPFPYPTDRIRSYQSFPDELTRALGFDGDLWDYDVYITNRVAQIPTARIAMNGRSSNERSRLVVALEEMPLCSFKPTVLIQHEAACDLLTVAGHLMADLSLITVQHEKDGLLQTARRYFSPSQVRRLEQSIVVANPSLMGAEFRVKEPSEFWHARGRPFCLGFTGRMANFASRVREVYEIMEKSWISAGLDQMRVVISTVTRGIKIAPPPFVEQMSLPRAEFWKLLREEIDVIVTFPRDAGFGMSQIEPIMFGVPIVAVREQWSEGLFGADYPFLASNIVQAFAHVKAFRTNYAAEYAKFARWQQERFAPAFRPGGRYALSYYDALWRAVDAHEEGLSELIRSFGPNDVVDALHAQKSAQGELRIREALLALDESFWRNPGSRRKLLRGKDDIWLAFSADLNEIRLRLMKRGWKDASVEVGDMYLTSPS